MTEEFDRLLSLLKTISGTRIDKELIHSCLRYLSRNTVTDDKHPLIVLLSNLAMEDNGMILSHCLSWFQANKNSPIEGVFSNLVDIKMGSLYNYRLVLINERRNVVIAPLCRDRKEFTGLTKKLVEFQIAIREELRTGTLSMTKREQIKNLKDHMIGKLPKTSTLFEYRYLDRFYLSNPSMFYVFTFGTCKSAYRSLEIFREAMKNNERINELLLTSNDKSLFLDKNLYSYPICICV
jgi:hypothetical protein